MIRGGQTYYYHADGLESIIAITDSAGNVVQRYEYDSFGAITYTQEATFKQPYTYTGREYDDESGLYYYRARYNDSKIGRFISEDPIGFNGGDVNFYAYVGNNPVNFVDPLGLTSIPWPIVIAPAIPIVISPAGAAAAIGAAFLFWPTTLDDTDDQPIDDLRRQLEEAKCYKAYAECIKGCIKCPGEGGAEAMECIRNICVPALNRCLARIK